MEQSTWIAEAESSNDAEDPEKPEQGNTKLLKDFSPGRK